MNIENAGQFLISRGKLPELNETGRELFHDAIKNERLYEDERLEEVKAWLTVGMSVDIKHADSYPIIRAAEGNCAEIIEFLADSGADLNVRDRSGDTALHTAIKWGADDALNMLIQKKSPIDTSNIYGITPLFTALEKKNTAHVNALLDAGADPNYFGRKITGRHFNPILGFAATKAPKYLQTLVDKGGDPNRLIHGQTSLTDRLIEDEKNAAAIGRLIGVGADPTLANEFGWTPMMICQVRDASKKSDLLLEAGVKNDAPNGLVNLFKNRHEPDFENIKLYLEEFDVDVTDETGHTLLTSLARFGTAEMVTYLLEQGANPNLFIDNDRSPLYMAARENNHEIVKLLLEHGAKPNEEDGHSQSLMRASYGATETVALLLEAGANPTSCEDSESALQRSIFKAPTKLIKLLLNAGADYNRFNDTRDSPLTYAIDRKRPKVVALLLAAGADVNNRNDDGNTALYHATNGAQSPEKTECIQILLEASADSKLTAYSIYSATPYKNAKTFNSKIAEQILAFETTAQYEKFGGADLAAFAKQVDTYRLQLWIEKDLEFAEKLIRAGAGKEATDVFSSIATALEIQNIDLVKLLLDEGHSPNGQNHFESVLQVACRHGSLEGAEILLDAGAEFTSGQALCNAVESMNLKLVELLLERGADADAMKVGWTPLYRAASKGYRKMVELFLAAGASPDTRTRYGQTAGDIAVENEYEHVANLLGRAL